ncbi:ABC transporter ATP-binding protein [Arenibaculum sp.]|jgi:ABC-type branched-subunit amino acid transport system ATPase component|uniref:ABC transporter ATP-binding protein n=1 Tax=Arenibaculum sp. TaxID=2865862 RepID=UPI002E1496EC|nr:ABC transporter ATP-binding protein [Arenibaculum sp.]
MTGILELHGISLSFGGLKVAQSVDLRLDAGARHALIGPNGAGKTTLINLITGVLAPSSGSVRLNGIDVTRLSQGQRVKRGIVRTFQISQLFPTMSAVENVVMAIAERDGLARVFWRPLVRFDAAFDEAHLLLERVGLGPHALTPIVHLSYGRRRLVELAIALALKPRVLLLDEPAAGVPSLETDLILDCLAALESDIAILLIDHDMDLVFRFAREITVLVSGAVYAHGAPDEIARDPEVKTIYFGEAA